MNSTHVKVTLLPASPMYQMGGNKFQVYNGLIAVDLEAVAERTGMPLNEVIGTFIEWESKGWAILEWVEVPNE